MRHRAAATALVLSIMIAASGCAPARTDRIMHAVFSADVCCLAAGTAFHLGVPEGSAAPAGLAAALAAGLAEEVRDSFSGSGFDPVDLLADIAGAALGYVAAEHLIVED